MRRFVVSAIVVILLALTSCGDGGVPTGLLGPGNLGPAMVISDAAHPPGAPGFYFLPPMVPDPGQFSGTFDATLSPVVRVCQWVNDACQGTEIVFNGGTGAQKITVNVNTESYNGVWQATGALSVGDVYRLRVYESISASEPLGYADLKVVAKTKDAKELYPDFIGVVRGSPFQIKFRIETAGPADAAPSVTSTTPANGAINVATTANLSITFSEAVDLTSDWFLISCATSGDRGPGAATVTGGPTTFSIDPDADFAAGEVCTVTVYAAQVSDQDAIDPPDNMAADYVFSFTVASGNVAPTANDDALTATVGVQLNADLFADNGSGPDELGTPAATITTFGGGDLGGTSATFPAGASPTLGASGGEVTVNADGSLSLTAPTTPGTYTFRYVLTNVAGSDEAEVTITVEAPSASPTANDDQAAANSAPGDAFHTAFNTTLTAPSGNTPSLLANDLLGNPAATITSFGGGSAGGTVTSNAPGATVNSADGQLTVNGDGSFTFQPTTGFTGLFTFSYRLENTEGFDDADVTIAVGVRPVANPETYPNSLVGNISINTATGTPYTVLANDAGDATTVALVAASETNGEVTLNSDGTFTFNPTAGFRSGNGTFQYTISNGFGTSAPATVTIPVGAQVIWFIDNNAAACTTLADGCGRLSNPLSTLAAFQTMNALGTGNNPADNHHIFVYQSATGYAGGVTLRSGQRLIGQDATSTLLALTGVTLPAHSPALPAMNSGDATKTTFDGATGGIVLNSGNHLHGFTASPSTGTGILGASVGALLIRDVAVSTAAGPAVDFATGTVDVVLTSVSSSSSTTRGINLAAINGTVNLGSGSLAGSTGEALRISGGTANISYSGSITNASDKAVSISGKTGGTVTLSGNITDTGTGIDLSNNTGATVNFTGILAVSTGANPAFSATGGGTVSATNNASTLATTTATALNVANTTIGASGLTFRSIASNGAANGIILNNTGAAAGLTVAGNAGLCNVATPTCTGGTIQNSTGDGILLTSTRSVNLSLMRVTSSGDDGIDGTSVNGFSLVNSLVTNNGNAANEEGISFSNLSGAVTLTNVVATGNAYHNLRIDNTTGTISSLAISGGSYSNNSAVIGNHGILIEPRGTSQITTATISGATISGNRVMGIQVATADNAVVSSFTVSGNTIQNNELGIDFSKAQTSSMTFSILNNLGMTGHNSHGINVFTAVGAGTTGAFKGTIQGNTIGNGAVAGSGSRIGNCIRVNINGDADADVLIDGNTIRECPVGRGIEVVGRNGTGGLDVTITNNAVNHVNLTFDPANGSDFPLSAIFVQSNCAGVCNTVRAGAAFDLLSTFIALLETSGNPSPPGTSTLELVNTTAAASCTQQLTNTNTGSASANAGCSLIAGPINTP